MIDNNLVIYHFPWKLCRNDHSQARPSRKLYSCFLVQERKVFAEPRKENSFSLRQNDWAYNKVPYNRNDLPAALRNLYQSHQSQMQLHTSLVGDSLTPPNISDLRIPSQSSSLLKQGN